MKIKEVSEALKIFVDASRIQVEATEVGDYKLGNKNYHKIIKSVKYLIEYNSINKLEPYLESEVIGEQLWAAYFLLINNENKAVQVLEKISLNKGVVGFTAEVILSEWRKGNIKYVELG